MSDNYFEENSFFFIYDGDVPGKFKKVDCFCFCDYMTNYLRSPFTIRDFQLDCLKFEFFYVGCNLVGFNFCHTIYD